MHLNNLRSFVTLVLMVVGLLVAAGGMAKADMLAGLPDMTAANDEIVSITHAGTTYVSADGDLTLGTTTRWWIDAAGAEVLWDPDNPATDPPTSPPPVSGTSSPKAGDIGGESGQLPPSIE